MEFYCAGTKPAYHNGKRCLAILFAGCNFRCHYCYNGSILSQKKEFIVQINDIRNSITHTESGYVLFCGGEPILQKFPLLSLAKFSKEKGLKNILLTNGSKPDVIKAILRESLFDEIVLSIKAPFDENYQKVTQSETYFLPAGEVISQIRKTIGLFSERSEKTMLTIETTIVPNLVFRKEDVLKIADEISGLKCRWKLSAFMPGDCADKRYNNLKPFSKTFMMALKDAVLKEEKGMDVIV
ncbi:MAG: 4Fe-4S cluster-binding domain-containing protein [archaeon]